MFYVSIVFLLSCCCSVEMVIVEVEQGCLEGEELEASTGDGTYYSFKGIPYAAPPVGNLRFKAPQPPIAWEGIRNATAHGPICIQSQSPENYIPDSEDCLFLNVYSPNLNPETPLPVIFFAHGGAFRAGSGNVDKYGPDFLVTHDVVVVTFNYRLEVLGFLCLDIEEVPGNAGLKDHVAALEWVQKNIQNFGGDPDNVTILGQSAGGASVSLLLLSPLTTGLFNRAIIMSGVFLSEPLLPFEPRERGFVLGNQLGLETYNATELYEFLLEQPAENLTGIRANVFISDNITSTVVKMIYFVPVVETDFGGYHFLTEDPEATLREGNVHAVDLLIGHTDMEGLNNVVVHKDDMFTYFHMYRELLVPRKITNVSPPKQIMELSRLIYSYYFGDNPIDLERIKELVCFYTDSNYIYDVHRFIRAWPALNCTKRYMYRFSGYSERNILAQVGLEYGLTGASHMDDLMYLFDAKGYNLTIEKNSTSYKMIKQTSTLFTNFAKYGNPTPDDCLGVIWPEYDQGEENFLEIAEDLTTDVVSYGGYLGFWKEILESAGFEF